MNAKTRAEVDPWLMQTMESGVYLKICFKLRVSSLRKNEQTETEDQKLTQNEGRNMWMRSTTELCHRSFVARYVSKISYGFF